MNWIRLWIVRTALATFLGSFIINASQSTPEREPWRIGTDGHCLGMQAFEYQADYQRRS